MPAYSAFQLAAIVNQKKRKVMRGGRPKGEAAPWPAEEKLQEERLRERPLQPPGRYVPDTSRRLPAPKRRREESNMPSNEPLFLEQRWSAVLELLTTQAKGELTNMEADRIAAEYGIGGGRHLHRLAHRAKETGSLLEREGRGAPELEDTDDILKFVREEAAERKWHFSYRFMGALVKGEFGVGSASTVFRQLKRTGWRDIRVKTRTFLTQDHIAARLTWCLANRGIDFAMANGITYYCDVDEKLFVAFKNGQVLHVPPDVREVVEEVLSKTQPTRLMFLMVIGPVNKDAGLNGKISLVSVMGPKVALRRSKYHEKGDEYEVPITMDGGLFTQILTKDVVQDLQRKLPPFITHVVIQTDSAGGHGNIDQTIKDINEKGKKKSKKRVFEYEMRKQPTRSPEANLNDLGAWRSLDSIVESVSYHPNPDRPRVEMLRDNVFDAWERWDSYEIFPRLCQSKNKVIAAIIEYEGRNDFPLPHSKKLKLKNVKP